MKLRFEEKAKLRQRLLEATTKTRQISWMLVEWVRTFNQLELIDSKGNVIQPTRKINI